jgi:hypothetical protein
MTTFAHVPQEKFIVYRRKRVYRSSSINIENNRLIHAGQVFHRH